MAKIRVNFHMGRLLGGGIETSLLTYLTNFDSDRYDVSLTVGWKMAELDRFTKLIPLGIKVRYLVSNKFLNSLKIKKIKNGKLNVIEKIIENLVLVPLGRLIYIRNFKKNISNYDIILDFGLSLPLECLNVDVPIITFLHFDLHTYLLGKLNNTKRMLYKFNKFAAVVTLNEKMLFDCQTVYPELVQKFHKIYNLFDESLIKSKAGELIDLDFGNYIVSVGRIQEDQKDFTTLINAFKILKIDKQYTGKLVIVGDGHDRERLEKFVQKLELNNDIVFVGQQSNPYKFMKNAEAFIFSSKSEGFGNVLVEAMIVGVPIVATDCPVGPREILQDGSCGKLVTVGDVNMMANSIHELLVDSNKKNNLITNANKRVKDFTVKDNINQFYSLINNIINER